MNDRIVVITGANSGIGRAACEKFAYEGYTVIMACRNLEISRGVQQEMIKATQNKTVDLIELDISSFDSIRKFCDTFKSKYGKLDILIHNAAYFNHSERNYQLSADHLELTFATNTFGPFLLTNLLLDLLNKSEDPRVLNACTTNMRHFFDPKRQLEFDNLQGENKESKTYRVYKMYGDSKMAFFMLTKKMAAEYEKDGIKINAIQIPAIKISKETLRKFKSPLWRVTAHVQNLFSDSQQSMANTYFHICTAEQFKDVTGELINDKREVMKPSYYRNTFIDSIKQFRDNSVYPRYADNEEHINKVWELSTKLTVRKL